MPYKNEYADKSSHVDIIKNPEIIQFISDCEFLTTPSPEYASELCGSFISPPKTDGISLPENIIAIDGSFYESSVQKSIPSTKIGYIKIGSLLISRKQFKSLKVMDDRFVDPFLVAALQKNNSALTFPLPSSNIVLKNKKTVRESIRYAIDKHLLEFRTDKENPKTSLRTTLFRLASMRSGELGTGNPDKLKIHKCPNCDFKNIELVDIEADQHCPSCNELIYPSDCLRLWEEVSEYQSNGMVLSRFMSILEHLIPIHYIRIIKDFSPDSFATILENVAFFIDGPLAIFGTAAWIHASIMQYLNSIHKEMEKHNKSKMLYIGLQKTGQVVDYVSLLNPYLPKNTLFAISDEYRYKYISPNNDPSTNGFGYETYYGQDFIYKTPTGRTFIFAIAYPFGSKVMLRESKFCDEKIKYVNYSELTTVLAMINEFECDLYENAVIPIALAHKYTAISLEPGSRVLDLLSKTKVHRTSQ